MRLIVCLLLAAAETAAQRPRYGGRLVVEMQASTVAEPAGFRIAETDTGKRVVLLSNDSNPGGRPFLDSIEVVLNRPLKDQLTDFELGKADVVELPPAEIRRQLQRNRNVWTSANVHLIALVFQRDHPNVQAERVRRGLALCVDRVPILNVLLQRQGESSGGVLPQWLSGFGFLYNAERDLTRARQLLTPPPPAITLGHDPNDPTLRAISDRLALNAREAGVQLRVVAGNNADLLLVRASAASGDPFVALEQYARALSLPVPAVKNTWESLQAAEKKLLEETWLAPLFHVPTVLGLNPRIRNWAPNGAVSPRWEDVWLEPQP